MNLFQTLAKLEDNDEIHMARLLILLGSFCGPNGGGRIEGLTKLAKLDFLLRYPVYLESALKAKNVSIREVQVADHERQSIESAMVRFRYGPWDFRYRRFINLLVAKGLVRVDSEGNTVDLRLTQNGLQVVKILVGDEAFADTTKRAAILKRHFDQRGTSLMRFIYNTFPEISTLRFGEDIGR
jgi:hypothetical protein